MKAPIIRNRRLKVSVRDPISQSLPGEVFVTWLNLEPSKRKISELPSGLSSQRIVPGGEGDARSVLRNGRRHCARACPFVRKVARVGVDVGANRAKMIRAAGSGEIFG